MNNDRIYNMTFSKLYPNYVNKAERKGRTKDEVDTLICWLTGYDKHQLTTFLESDINVESFFMQAPRLHPNAGMIKGMICGVRIEEIEDTRMKRIRYLDKIIDELAKGKQIEKIMRK